ncbi:hypothetical protein FRB99_003074 [Tulasnella sp. 403]|nr:hypothetical protein FRB99_003074 [Tulasnella sp. 403]
MGYMPNVIEQSDSNKPMLVFRERHGILGRSIRNAFRPLLHAAQHAKGGAPTSTAQSNPGADANTMSEHELYLLAQELKDSEANIRPLISSTEPIDNLRKEYENGGTQVPTRIDWLESQGWGGLRRTRGDGDCFYRSLAYSYVERIMYSEDVDLAVTAALSILDRTLSLLKEAGFQDLVYDDFYESFVELIRNIVRPDREGRVLNAQSLLEAFQTPEISNSVVVFLRLVTSAQMRVDPSAFEAFLLHPDTYEPVSVKEFCERFVEATGKEADHPQIAALTRALSVSVHVAYLAGSATDNSTTVDFVKFEPEGSQESVQKPVVLLYRPGHYDILERRATEAEPSPC